MKNWFALLVLTGAIPIGGYGCWEMTHLDELLRDRILQRFAEVAPNWDIRMGRVQYDWDSRVQIDDLEFRAPGQTTPVLTIPQAVCLLDRAEDNGRETFEVRTVQLRDPTVRLMRDCSRRWNWQKLPALPASDNNWPEWEIHGATLKFSLAQPEGDVPLEFSLSDANLRLTPARNGQYVIRGANEGECIANLDIVGHGNVIRRYGMMTGYSDVGRTVEAHSDTTEHFQNIDHRSRLKILGGNARFSPTSRLWTFHNITARHGSARISCSGSFASHDEPGLLDLMIAANEIDLEEQLSLMLPVDVQRVLGQLALAGHGRVNARIQWRPGQPVELTSADARIVDGTVHVPWLPDSLDGISADLTYADGCLHVDSLTCENGDARIQTDGFVEMSPVGEWRAKLKNIVAENVVGDPRFRESLPESIRELAEQLDLRGPVSVTGELELHGSASALNATSAKWDLTAALTNASLTTGIELNAIRGEVNLRGRSEGRQVEMQGTIDVDSLSVFGQQVTSVQGPIRFDGQHFLIGAGATPPNLFDAATDTNNAVGNLELTNQHLTANAVGGRLTLDATVTIGKEPTYRVGMSLADGRLEQFGSHASSRSSNVRGHVNGWIELSGTPDTSRQEIGRGAFQIHQAALYELPVFVRLFKVLSLAPPDATAFTDAHLALEFQRDRVRFRSIDLAGDAVSLRGYGTADYDGRLHLDLKSIPFRRTQSIPIVGYLAGKATDGWVWVRVRGHADAPQATIHAVPKLRRRVRRLLNVF